MTAPLARIYSGIHHTIFVHFNLLLLVALTSACQTSPLDFELSDSATATATTDTATVNYVMDSDSQIVDWQYDTADGTGGQDESCYQRTGNNGPVAWCDSPQLHAQSCDTFPSGCCCRQACSPAICASDSDFETPCQYFDIADPIGYCRHPADLSPVEYICQGTCTPRSDCVQVDSDGSCLDTEAEKSGMCLIYETEENPVFCQKSCELSRCDASHMCVPLFDSAGSFSDKGACVPVL
jgi:hypothetical protein